MGGFLNQDNLPHLVQKLTDADNIKITGNKHGDRVGKVVNKLIDKSNETLGASFKELKNEGYSFRTGEGSGVDLSNSTLDSFTTFALEGNTYKNLVKNGAEELVLNPEINKEGSDFELDGTFDGGQLKFEVEGQTLKNLVVDGQEEKIAHYITTYRLSGGKPNTTYTVMGELSNIKKGTYSGGLSISIEDSASNPMGGVAFENGVFKKVITNKSTFGKVHFWTISTKLGQEYAIKNITVLEGDHTQKPTPNFIEGVQGVGRKGYSLVEYNGHSNLKLSHSPSKNYTIVDNIFTFKNNLNGAWNGTIEDNVSNTFYKDNTTYTLYVEILENTLNKPISFDNHAKCSSTIGIKFNPNETGIKRATFTIANRQYNGVFRTPLDLNNNYGNFKFRVMIYEGNEIKPYEPYRETGYKIGVKTHGKNLFNIDSFDSKKIGVGEYEVSTGVWQSKTITLPFKEKTQYTFKATQVKHISGNGWLYLKFVYTDGTDSQLKYVLLKPNNNNDKVFTSEVGKTLKEIRFVYSEGGVYVLKNIQLEEGTQATSYEPYKESINEIILQDQLQGIGDIKDRLYYDNGYKVEKHIDKIILDEKFTYWQYKDKPELKVYGFYTILRNGKNYGQNKFITDYTSIKGGFPGEVPNNDIAMEVAYNQVYQENYFKFSIEKSKITTNIKDYLKDNPIVVYVADINGKYETIDTKTKSEALATFNTKTYITQDSGVKGNIKISNKGYKTYNLLPNKEYTVMVDKQGNSPITLDLCGVKKVIDGDKGTVSTSTNNIGELKFYGNGKTKNIRLLEGNVANNKTVGYFEGVQGVGDEPKNLCRGYGIPMELEQGYYTISSATTPGAKRFKITGASRDDLTIPDKEIYWHEQDQVFVSSNDNERLNRTFRVNKKCTICLEDRSDGVRYEKLQVEKGVEATEYEAFRESGYALKASSQSKNLINLSSMNFPAVEQYDNKTCVVMKDDGDGVFTKGIRFKKGAQYSLTLKAQKEQAIPQTYCQIRFDYTDGTSVVERPPYGTLRTLVSQSGKTLKQIVLNRWNLKRVYFELDSLMLEEGSTGSSYEPYEESDFSIELEEPLMRLPNGVCDEITKDGKLIRRVGKIVLTGASEEKWSAAGFGGHATRNTFEYSISKQTNPSGKQHSVFAICNNFHVERTAAIPEFDNGLRVVRSAGPEATDYILCSPSTDLVPHRNLVKWREWLSEHPLEIYYDLEKEVTTDIKPLQARLFKNGHIIFDNKIAPVSTYEVAVNKPAQINAGIKETQKLENRVNALEGLYDSMLLENSHILSNLEFDFSLMKEVEE